MRQTRYNRDMPDAPLTPAPKFDSNFVQEFIDTTVDVDEELPEALP